MNTEISSSQSESSEERLKSRYFGPLASLFADDITLFAGTGEDNAAVELTLGGLSVRDLSGQSQEVAKQLSNEPDLGSPSSLVSQGSPGSFRSRTSESRKGSVFELNGSKYKLVKDGGVSSVGAIRDVVEYVEVRGLFPLP